MGTKSIKAFLLVGLFILISSQSFGQVLKFHTLEAATSEKLADGNWGPWSEVVGVMQSVVMNFDNGTITIAANPKQVFNILEIEEQETDEDGDDYFYYLCEDAEEGEDCRILLMVMHSEGGRPMMSLEFEDGMVLYKMTYAK